MDDSIKQTFDDGYNTDRDEEDYNNDDDNDSSNGKELDGMILIIMKITVLLVVINILMTNQIIKDYQADEDKNDVLDEYRR